VAYERLQQLVGAFEVERSMIHSVLLKRNVLTAEGKISAIIDWGCAMYGDFLYDLAWFSYWSPWYSTMQGINWAAHTEDDKHSLLYAP
jgi:hygromycin-B 4-O-kinase